MTASCAPEAVVSVLSASPPGVAAGPRPTRSHLDAVDERSGPIREVVLLRAAEGLWTALALGSSTPGSAGIPVLCHGTATSADAGDARDRAIYEALERYCAGFWSVEELRPAPAAGATDGASEGPEVAMRTLDGSAEVLAPAARVYLPFAHGGRCYDGDSVGLACGRSDEDALDRAVDELLERWLVEPWVRSRCSADPEPGPDATLAAERATVIGRVALGACTRHVAVAMLGADRPPYGALGFGCHATEAQALQKALAEARHVRAHMVMLASEGRRPQRRPAVGLEAALHRAAFDRPVAARFNAAMDAASPQDPWPLRRLAHRDVLWRNLTTPEVRSMGLEVVRAVFSPALGKPPPMPDSGWPPQLG